MIINQHPIPSSMAIDIRCPVCNEHITYLQLQTDEPRCTNGHSLGRWVMCNGPNGNHVFLSRMSREEGGEGGGDEGQGIATTTATTATTTSARAASSIYGYACPVCGSKEKASVPKGIKVKCMKIYPDGRVCPTPEYSWLVEGPPCFLNHVDVIVVR